MSKSDWHIIRRAVNDGYVVVTNNAKDFKELVNREELHAGLVCLNFPSGLVDMDIQKYLFSHDLEHLDDSEPLNEVLEVTLQPGGDVEVTRYDLPPR